MLYAIGLETRTLFHRIALQYKLRLDCDGVDLGPFLESTEAETYRVNTQTLACNEDIKRSSERLGRLTAVDVLLFQEAWHSGARWAFDNPHRLPSDRT